MHKVIGQTGKTVLSGSAIHYGASKRRTIRYRYTKLSAHSWLAWVVGPFHSRTYGVCGFGTKKASAKKSLIRNLGNNYGYIGNLVFSDVDESDTVGDVNPRLLDNNTIAAPITCNV